jgi:hypothetical protein
MKRALIATATLLALTTTALAQSVNLFNAQKCAEGYSAAEAPRCIDSMKRVVAAIAAFQDKGLAQAAYEAKLKEFGVVFAEHCKAWRKTCE